MENKFKVGDLVKGKEGNGYGITNENMTLAKVIKIRGNNIDVEILEHKKYKEEIGRKYFDLNSEGFELKKFEVGDKVKIRGDVTLDEIKADNFNGCQDNTMKFLHKQSWSYNKNFENIFEVKEVSCGSLKLVEEEYSINEVIFEIVEKHKEEPKEMTVEEISKALGYEIKVVKG